MTDDTIENITDDANRIADSQQVHEWNRETMLVSTYGFCVYCDGPIEEPVTTEKSSVKKYTCRDCHRGWAMRDETGDDRSPVSSDGSMRYQNRDQNSDSESDSGLAPVFRDPGDDAEDGDGPVTEVPLDTGDRVRDVHDDEIGTVDCDPNGASDGTIIKITFDKTVRWIPKRVFREKLNERYILVDA